MQWAFNVQYNLDELQQWVRCKIDIKCKQHLISHVNDIVCITPTDIITENTRCILLVLARHLVNNNPFLSDQKKKRITPWLHAGSMIPYNTSTVHIECLTCDHACFPQKSQPNNSHQEPGKTPLLERISCFKDVLPSSAWETKNRDQFCRDFGWSNISVILGYFRPASRVLLALLLLE
jgi:hypothetical protein